MKNSGKGTVFVHAGETVPASFTQPKVAPICPSSVWKFDDLDAIDDIYEGKRQGYIYSRMANPTVAQLEEAVAEAEGGAAGAAYGSGMGAIAAALLAEVSAGSHVLAHRVLYGGTYSLLANELVRFGVAVTFADFTDLANVEREIRPDTAVIYLETICNPLMEVLDLPAIVEIAGRAGARVIVDNTFATPFHCRPLEHGAGTVVHSATKYLNGHSDVTAGVVVADRAAIDRVRRTASVFGPTLSPFDAWLTLRGMRTLHLRMERHSANALALARFLADHPKVGAVYYPGLETSPNREAAGRLLANGYGGMLSFVAPGGLEGAKKVIGRLKLTQLVPSLAGPSTTTSHPGKTSHRAIPAADRAAFGVGDDLIRVSTGIEDVGDIIADFAQALAD